VGWGEFTDEPEGEGICGGGAGEVHESRIGRSESRRGRECRAAAKGEYVGVGGCGGEGSCRAGVDVGRVGLRCIHHERRHEHMNFQIIS
jgi:hypothetical protein